MEAAPHTINACWTIKKDYIVRDPKVRVSLSAMDVSVVFALWLQNSIWINFSTVQPEHRSSSSFLRPVAQLKKDPGTKKERVLCLFI